jgi:hypothetical protein
MLPRVLLAASIAFPVLCLFAACGAGDVSPPPPLTDAGVDGSNVTESGGESSSGGTTQQGQIVDLTTKLPVAGAQLTLGTGSATTDAQGKYTASVDPSKSFNMKVEKGGYYTLTEQETLVKEPIDLGKTSFLPEGTATLLLGTLTGYDSTKGVLSVAIENQGCADEAGAQFTMTGPDGKPIAGSSLYYFDSGFPSATATAAKGGEFPHAVAFNIPVGTAVTVSVTHPTCKMIPFPVDKPLDTGKVTYVSATISTSPGKATSFTRVFLK